MDGVDAGESVLLVVAAIDAVERAVVDEAALCVGDTLAERVADGEAESLLKLALCSGVEEGATLRLTLLDCVADNDTRGVFEEELHFDASPDTDAEPETDAVTRVLADTADVRDNAPLVDADLLTDGLDEKDGDARPVPDLGGDLLTEDVARGELVKTMELVDMIDADAIDELGVAVAVAAALLLDAALTETLLVIDADTVTVPETVTSPTVAELQTVALALAQPLELDAAVDDTVPLGDREGDAERSKLAVECPLGDVESIVDTDIDGACVSVAELDESSDADEREDGDESVDWLGELLDIVEGVGDVEDVTETIAERESLALEDGDRDLAALPDERPVPLVDADSEGE
jgi:hypothetical protein